MQWTTEGQNFAVVPVDLLVSLQASQQLCVPVTGVLDFRDPHVHNARDLVWEGEGALHGATVVVATHNDMLDLQGVNGELQGGHAVHVSVHGQVTDVTLDEHLTGV